MAYYEALGKAVCEQCDFTGLRVAFHMFSGWIPFGLSVKVGSCELCI